MGNMRFKVGDRVRIKSIDWYNENKDKKGNVYFEGGKVKPCFSHCMSIYCGQIMTISDAIGQLYDMIEDDRRFCWVDEMIEGLVEDEVDLIPKFGEYSDNEPLDIPTITTEFVKEYGLPCPEGYIFKDENGNVINATKIVLEKKKKEYPKTYEECYQITGLLKTSDIYGYKNGLLFEFQKLLIARDAYWKIAGEEMGLGKPWKPDWIDGEWKWCVCYSNNNIEFDSYKSIHHTFSFPTEEMRDMFYENFKELIEMCKELL